MGHTYRDLFPAKAEAQDNYNSRLIKLRKEIKNMPLSHFTVADAEALSRIMGLDVKERDVKQLEKSVQKIKSKKRGKQ